MRRILSDSIGNSAKENKDFILLSGDHGYALFDNLRNTNESQFLNVGIMEQAMIGIAAGLFKAGFRPMCYGLSSFVPIRVLEQIKFDLCLQHLPVKLIGDGAGLVYSTLGNSHLCAEDISCLLPLPKIEIYSPGDKEEMRICYHEFENSTNPAYLRVGKADNPTVNKFSLKHTDPYFVHRNNSKICFVSTGSMLGVVNELADEFKVNHLSIMKIKPLSSLVVKYLKQYEKLFIFEEHSRKGGLLAQILDQFIVEETTVPPTKSFSLNHSFIDKCGSYQYAISEHGLQKNQLFNNLNKILR